MLGYFCFIGRSVLTLDIWTQAHLYQSATKTLLEAYARVLDQISTSPVPKRIHEENLNETNSV